MVNSIVIVGGGHAGVEAALAASRLGVSSMIITMDLLALGRLSCNPAIGGLAKSHLVKEIDALGGIMGFASDQAALQYKTLNKTKGRAVWANRVQLDKKEYPLFIQKTIKTNKYISVLEDEVVSLVIKKNCVVGVNTNKAGVVNCSSVIVTCGTFLNGLIHIGDEAFRAGRLGEKGSCGLTENLIDLGFCSGRLKTGTPPRISKKSIDLKKVALASGDEEYSLFSVMSKKSSRFKPVDCFVVNTNTSVHSLIKDNFLRSPIFSGKIKAVGPRYCPSIEDKISRFSDRDSHHLFLEPEWRDADQIYVNGFSTSLPQAVQLQALSQIPALKNVEFIRPGYAIEYDFFPPRQLKSSLETKALFGLFFAGQINGTSGYEEAAAQGLVAGVNSAKFVLKKEPLVLPRSSSYIGVMIDDLITSHLDEPYRMFTSRAEHRLFLRSDNCYSRLFPYAKDFSLLTVSQKKRINEYLCLYKDLDAFVSDKKVVVSNRGLFLKDLIKRPEEFLLDRLDFSFFEKRRDFCSALFELETTIKYSGYIKNEKDRIEKTALLENLKLPLSLNYKNISGLSSESKERLIRVRPQTLGQASRVFGVRPTDVTLLGFYVGSLDVSRET